MCCEYNFAGDRLEPTPNFLFLQTSNDVYVFSEDGEMM